MEYWKWNQDAETTLEDQINGGGGIAFPRGKAVLLGATSVPVQGAARGEGAKSSEVGRASRRKREKKLR